MLMFSILERRPRYHLNWAQAYLFDYFGFNIDFNTLYDDASKELRTSKLFWHLDRFEIFWKRAFSFMGTWPPLVEEGGQAPHYLS